MDMTQMVNDGDDGKNEGESSDAQKRNKACLFNESGRSGLVF